MKLKKILNQRVLVKIDSLEEATRGGLFIQAEVRTPYSIGEVILVSDEITKVTVGDRVIFSKHAGTGFKEDQLLSSSDEFKIIQESDLLGVIDGNDSQTNN